MSGKRKHPEDDLQRAIVQLLMFGAAPGVYFAAIPNGGFRRHLEAAIMTGLGVRKGIADLLVIGPGARVHFIEVKAPNGRLSSEQREFADWCTANQVPHAVVASIDSAIDVLGRWGLIRVHGAETARAAA